VDSKNPLFTNYVACFMPRNPIFTKMSILQATPHVSGENRLPANSVSTPNTPGRVQLRPTIYTTSQPPYHNDEDDLNWSNSSSQGYYWPPQQAYFYENEPNSENLGLPIYANTSMTGNGFFSNRNHPPPNNNNIVTVTAPSRPQSGSLSANSSPAHHPYTRTKEKEPNGNKKWSFGGFFKRKAGSNVKSPGGKIRHDSPTPGDNAAERGNVSNAFSQTKDGAIGESDLSTDEDGHDKVIAYKQNFFARKLSRRREKSDKKKSEEMEKLRVPGHSRLMSSSPEGVWETQSTWEKTKKLPPSLIQHHSSSGSLAPSVDGSTSKRAAAKEAMKARAIARRESYMKESTSSGDEHEGDYAGSQSSLNSAGAIKNWRGGKQMSASPKPSPRKHHLTTEGATAQAAPVSPRWKARVVYQQENLEDEQPVVLKLPGKRALNGNTLIGATERISEDDHVITAGLTVPVFSSPSHNQPQYENWAQNGRTASPNTLHSVTPSPPLPPRRDFSNNVRIQYTQVPLQVVYRPVSCSYLDSYNGNAGQPQHIQNNGFYPHPHSGNRNDSPAPYYVDQTDNIRRNVNGPINGNYILNGAQYNGNSNKLQLIRSPSEPPEIKIHEESNITSKMGYPVRKLNPNNTANNLPHTQSPVHTRASEFWRKKEQEVANPGNHKVLNRVRSADSSPLMIPKSNMRRSPGGAAHHLNSNESVSSLSSFSADSPNHLKNSPGRNPSPLSSLRPKSLQYQYRAKNGGSANTNNGEIKRPSAVERLKLNHTPPMKKASTPNNNASPTHSNTGDASKPPPHSSNSPVKVKTPGKNLEDALNELEKMYRSLRLSDEDLLDRAERRDLPTAHQELRHQPLKPLPPSYSDFNGSVESLISSNQSYHSSENLIPHRNRAPPLRRAYKPDRVADDMAKRRIKNHSDAGPLDPRTVVSKVGSYLNFSPAFSPPASPCPPSENSYTSSASVLKPDDPDLVFDDLSFRYIKRANAIKVIEDQPPFGIPLEPSSPAPASDYLHTKPKESFRPLYNCTKLPDVIRDDIAFRALRKDASPESTAIACTPNKDWTPRLFSPTRDQRFQYDTKKSRAIRSLSANVTNMAPVWDSVDYRDQKWGSSVDINGDHFNKKMLAYYQNSPSWVDQIQRHSSSETLTERFERKTPKKTVKLEPPIYDPSKPRRPWTDILLQSFEEQEKKAQEEAENSKMMEENEEDAELLVLSINSNPNSMRPGTPTPEIKSRFSDIPHHSFVPTNTNHNRRGSWVEPRATNEAEELSIESPANSLLTERRKSWSDLPSGAMRAKLIPNPAPQFRKVKPVALDEFDTMNEGKTVDKKSEAELNNLMDALLRDADTCGPPEEPECEHLEPEESVSNIDELIHSINECMEEPAEVKEDSKDEQLKKHRESICDELDSEFKRLLNAPADDENKGASTSAENQPKPQGKTMLGENGEGENNYNSGLLLAACYLLTFIHSFSQLDWGPTLGLCLAVLVFIFANFM